jgi:REP element-mobilizing transposase RayT
VFHDLYLGRIVVQTMRYHELAGNAETLACVVMPDHVHWLFSLMGQTTLAQLVGSVKGYSANRIQKIRRERGEIIDPVQPLWQEGYHDHALRQEEDVKSVARYIIGNPLRAGLVENIGDYSLWDAVWV